MKTNFTDGLFYGLLSLLLLCTSSLYAQNGYVWATAGAGGCLGGGTVVRGSANGTNFTTMACFNDSIGGQPQGSPVMASNGKLYIVCFFGGTTDSCTVCTYDTTTGLLDSVVDFYNPEHPVVVFDPVGGLVQASNGKLYGMTSAAANGVGAIYSIDPATNAYQVVYSFVNGPPVSNEMLLANDGRLYLATYTEDMQEDSVAIYAFDPASSSLSRMPNFTMPSLTGDGSASPLIQGSDGKLYGICNLNNTITGADSSVIFSYDLTTQSSANLYYIGYYSVGGPTSGLVQANDGKLYGMIQSMTNPTIGGVYSFDLSTLQFQYVVQASAAFPASVYSTLYDMTKYGADELAFSSQYAGPSEQGQLLCVNTVTQSTRVLMSFDSASTGEYPQCNILITGAAATGIAEVNTSTNGLYPNPASDHILLGNITTDTPYTVTNLLGEVLLQGSLTEANNSVNVSVLPAGIYFLNHQKFVKE